ncbi:MAG: hypothetical protein AAGI11_04360 [Pseudomonadota bacterium]
MANPTATDEELKRALNKGYFHGLALGLLIGSIAGAAVGYSLGSNDVTIVTWDAQQST